MSEYEHHRNAQDEDASKDDVEAHRHRHAADEGKDDDSKESTEPDVEAHRHRHRHKHAGDEGTDSTEPDVEGLEVQQDHCFATDRFRWQFLPTPIDPDAFQLRNIYFNCLGLQNIPVQDHDRLKLRQCQNSSVLTTELQRMLWKLG